MKHLTPTTVFSLVGLTLLSACGGGGSGPGSAQLLNVPVDPPTGGVQALAALSLSSSTVKTRNVNGTVDLTSAIVALDGRSGTISADLTEAFLTDGSRLIIDATPDQNAWRFDFLSTTSSSENGIIGFPTSDDAMSNTGTARYNGDSELLVQVGTDVYELTAKAEMNVNFALRRDIQVRITDFEGTKFPLLGAPETASFDGEIRISEITRDGASLSGGEVDLIGTPFPVSFEATTELNGQFYGANPDEVGGTFVVDDEDTTTTFILGDFLLD